VDEIAAMLRDAEVVAAATSPPELAAAAVDDSDEDEEEDEGQDGGADSSSRPRRSGGGSGGSSQVRSTSTPRLSRSGSGRFDSAALASGRRVATLAAFAQLRESAPVLLKHGRRGRAHPSALRVHEGALYWNWADWKADAPSAKAIPLVTVTAVLSGRRTDELRRSARPADDGACFAVVSPTRRLSLQVVSGSSEERDLWVAGITVLVQVIREEQQFWNAHAPTTQAQ
jgi:hypothetical protein